ncbi:MAG: hypothetical protein ACKO5X_03450 [Limnohabitans sp.]
MNCATRQPPEAEGRAACVGGVAGTGAVGWAGAGRVIWTGGVAVAGCAASGAAPSARLDSNRDNRGLFMAGFRGVQTNTSGIVSRVVLLNFTTSPSG